MKNDRDLPNASYVCTFASARVGDSEFRKYYGQIINQVTYEKYLDLIPFLPPGHEDMDDMSTKMIKKVNG